ncbi:hypothetical protein [Pseudomonas sivasensis]|uniref:hypothetical protein n=1 Tax=Pseudomonas sivasensis TaxID=1880678 RepID=UPI0030DD4286
MNIGSITTSGFFELDAVEADAQRRISSAIALKVNWFPAVNHDQFPLLLDQENSLALKSVSYPWKVTFDNDHAHAIAKWSVDSLTTNAREKAVGMSDVFKTIEMLYLWEHNDQGRMASAYAVYFVECNFSKNNLSAVNSLLLNASPERLTEWSMVAILRASFSAKAHLPAWSKFMVSVRERLKDNERLERLLVGLSR